MAESLHILLGTSACLQWLCHSGERTVARGPLVFATISEYVHSQIQYSSICKYCVSCTNYHIRSNYTTQSLLRITFLMSDILFILSPYIIKLLLKVNRCSGLINV